MECYQDLFAPERCLQPLVVMSDLYPRDNSTYYLSSLLFTAITISEIYLSTSEFTSTTDQSSKELLALYWGTTWLCKVQFDAQSGGEVRRNDGDSAVNVLGPSVIEALSMTLFQAKVYGVS